MNLYSISSNEMISGESIIRCKFTPAHTEPYVRAELQLWLTENRMENPPGCQHAISVTATLSVYDTEAEILWSTLQRDSYRTPYITVAEGLPQSSFANE